MKREVIPQGRGKSCVTILFPLGTKDDDQALKLDNEILQKEINEIAKKIRCEYAVRLNGELATAEICFTHQGVVTDQDEHDYETKAINFMSEVDKLELQKQESECPTHDENEDDKENKDDLKFIKKLYHDIQLPQTNSSHVCGALIIDTTTNPFCPELTGWGSMSYSLLKELCELYLKAHEQD